MNTILHTTLTQGTVQGIYFCVSDEGRACDWWMECIFLNLFFILSISISINISGHISFGCGSPKRGFTIGALQQWAGCEAQWAIVDAEWYKFEPSATVATTTVHATAISTSTTASTTTATPTTTHVAHAATDC